MMATWSDSEDSSSEEEQKEVANLCFMANNDEVKDNSEPEFTFEELENAFYELMHDFKKIKQENKKLKENISSLSSNKEKSLNEIDKLTQEVNILKNQNLELTSGKDNLLKERDALKKELEKVKPFVEKFIYSSEKLNMLLNNQRAIFNRAGLGYKSKQRQKYFKNFFISASYTVTCICCGKSGHKAYHCLYKNSNSLKKIWVPKETILTNPKRPKMTWVPKLKT